MSNRLFIALEIPIKIKEKITEFIFLIDRLGKINWETSNKFHITLKFLGETPKDKETEIKEILTGVLSEKKPFSLEINKFGLFRKNGKPKILWAGIRENKDLTNTVNILDTKLNKIGFKKETREFFPHITLSRLKNINKEKSVLLEKFTTLHFDPIEFSSDKIVLFKSILKPEGAIYKTIEEFYL